MLWQGALKNSELICDFLTPPNRMNPTKKCNEISERRHISEKMGEWGDYDLVWRILMVFGNLFIGNDRPPLNRPPLHLLN